MHFEGYHYRIPGSSFLSYPQNRSLTCRVTGKKLQIIAVSLGGGSFGDKIYQQFPGSVERDQYE
jgi:hypothetical protein